MNLFEHFNIEEAQALCDQYIVELEKLREHRLLLIYRYAQTNGRSHTIRKQLDINEQQIFSNEALAFCLQAGINRCKK